MVADVAEDGLLAAVGRFGVDAGELALGVVVVVGGSTQGSVGLAGSAA